MAAPVENVTEFSRIRLQDGINALDESSDAGKALSSVLDETLKQPGVQRIYTSHEIEDPANLWLFVDWETSEHRNNYRKSEEYASHVKVIGAYRNTESTAKDFSKLVDIYSSPEDVLDSKGSRVTEVLIAYFPHDYDADSRSTAMKRVGEFVADGLKASPDWRGISCGWSVDNDVPVRGDESQSGVAFVSFIAWPSVEAHLKFRETEAFKSTIHHLREIPGLVKLSAFHVSCKSKAAEGQPKPCANEYHQHGGGCC
ncbi:unnamed protein product [Clonostachys rhizophaga]|uniref:ABM domain-containing protein n=1 Tax=Clonostachys rhizophaga TaxID=160324 RepID=A0A9N9VZK8_9HYPO|nr:unnamed protein product [Clonostachys rhizophaga]